MGHGLPFRAGLFDGAISISALQWLCYSNRRTHAPHRRLRAFFTSLYGCLARGARAALQFYPENPAQMEMITHAAMASGFTGGLVVDYPNSTKAKKYYLVLFSGGGGGGGGGGAGAGAGAQELPRGLTGDEGGGGGGGGAKFSHGVGFERNRGRKGGGRHGKRGHRPAVKSREWIQSKKERRRRQGKKTARDSKYTGRRRQKW